MEQKLTDLLEELPKNNYNTYYQSSAGRGKHKTIMSTIPSPIAEPFSWDYERTKEFLYRLSEILTPEEAERLNIQFENPSLKDIVPAALAPTVRGGIQLLKPGQKAPTHKHSPNAFRLILEAPADDAYTVVNGVELPMHTGDLVLTPNWTWHDHHNDSSGDVIWFDGLDIIFVYWIGGVFYSLPKGEKSPNTVAEDGNDNFNEYGSGLVPDTVHGELDYDPMFYYPYEKARQALVSLAKTRTGESSVTLEYTNPITGGPVFPSMGLKLTMVRGGKTTPLIQRTENKVVICMEGEGEITLSSGKKIELKSHNVAVIPSWEQHRISSGSSDLVLFTYSDEPIFRAMKLFRENLSK
ncbi:hypothetical protein IX51_08920 [uncultured archaeon]|nr:hypothetical protein IX51_08920 [uncultured archaeon]